MKILQAAAIHNSSGWTPTDKVMKKIIYRWIPYKPVVYIEKYYQFYEFDGHGVLVIIKNIVFASLCRVWNRQDLVIFSCIPAI